MRKIEFKNNVPVMIGLLCLVVLFFEVRNNQQIKDSLNFSKENVVATWVRDQEDEVTNYEYDMSKEDVSNISKELSKYNLKKSYPQNSPSQELPSVTLLLDGKKVEDNEGTSYEYERKIHITKMNEEEVFMYIELNSVEEGNGMKTLVQKYYDINSKDLVKYIDNICENNIEVQKVK